MAGSATVGILRVLLTANSAEFDSAMKRVSDTAKTFSKDLGTIGKQATAIGTTLTKAITLPLLGIAAGSIKAAMDFESSFAGVRKTVNATEKEFAELSQGLRDMAKTLPVNVNELNKIAEAAGQLGIKKDDILQFTRVMADLGVTTNLTSDQAATGIAQIQNIFGAAGKDTDRFGAALVALGNAGASTESDILEMSKRIAGAGHQVGLTQGQVLAFASSLASVGINAEAGGSAISRVFLKINDAVASGGSKLDEFARISGMSSAAFKQAFETDAAGATTAFISGLGRLKGEGENVNATLEGVVGKNIILKDTLLRASGAGSLLTDNLKLQAQAWQENTALTKEAEQRYKTFDSQVKVLWAQIRDLGITIGTALLPTMRDLISVVTPVVKWVGALADGFAALPQPVRTTTVAILALLASVGPVVWAFGTLAAAAGTLIGAFTAKGIATRALTAIMATSATTTGIFSVALTALGTTAAIAATAFVAWNLGKWIGDITGATDAVGRFSAKLGEMIGILPEGTAAVYDASRAAAKAAGEIQNLGEKTEGAVSFTDDLGRAIAEMNSPLQSAAPNVRRFGDETETSGNKVKDATKELREFNNWIGERQMEAAALGIKAQEEFAASVTRTVAVFAPFKATIKSAQDELRALGGSLSDLASGSLLEYGTASTAARKEALDWAMANGAVLAPSIRAVGSAAVTAAETTLSAWQKAMAGLPQAIMSAIQGGGSVIGAAGAQMGTSLMTSFQAKFGPAITAALPFGIGAAVTSLLPTLGALFGPVAQKLAGFFKNIFGGPSSGEKEGRAAVAAFEAQLHSTLTETQKLEAGNESWKMTVIAIRDAYLAAGRTSEEAMQAAEDLWASSKDGAEATRRVIAEIQRLMNAIPDNKTIDVDVNYHDNMEPVTDPGFATGTMGRIGKFFGNFGAGMSTALHGVEAVLRPQDAVPFSLATLGSMMPSMPSMPSFAGMGGTTNSTANNLVFVAIPVEAAGDTYRITREVMKSLPSSIALDESGVRSGIERVIQDYTRTYGRG